jgi:LysM repeat protein
MNCAWRVSCVVAALSLPCGALWAASVPTGVDSAEVAPQVDELVGTPPDALDLSTQPESQPEALSILEEVVPPTSDVASPSAEPAPLTVVPPDADTLRRLVTTDPRSLSSLSIGRPDAGALLNAVPIPEGPLWRVLDPRRAWASEETVAFLTAAVEKVEARFPGSPPLTIGDVSWEHGGPLGRHRSHESGRDADIGWYFLDGPAKDLRKGDAKQLDLARSWALVRAFVTETDVEHIFMDRKLQALLFHYAVANGENQQWLLGLFGSVSGRAGAIIEHERGHKTHMHVRFYNRRAQEWARAAYPFLVTAGLAPPPVVMHKARRGETLAAVAHQYHVSVAAIRAANGLRSSAIRAGRRYRIPVCRAEAPDVPPLIVPARRLPPRETATLLDSGR